MDYQDPLPTGILQARILGWIAMPSSRGSSEPRDQTCISRQVLYRKHHLGSPNTPGSTLKKKTHLQLTQVIYTGMLHQSLRNTFALKQVKQKPSIIFSQLFEQHSPSKILL